MDGVRLDLTVLHYRGMTLGLAPQTSKELSTLLFLNSFFLLRGISPELRLVMLELADLGLVKWRVKLGRAQLVVNTLALNQKIRQSVSGLNLKLSIALVKAEGTVAIVDADLRNQREKLFLDGVDAENEFRQRRKDCRAN